jgi:hypothetical protein
MMPDIPPGYHSHDSMGIDRLGNDRFWRIRDVENGTALWFCMAVVTEANT